MDNPRKVRNYSLIGLPLGLVMGVAGFFGESTLGVAMGFIVFTVSCALFVVAALLDKAS